MVLLLLKKKLWFLFDEMITSDLTPFNQLRIYEFEYDYRLVHVINQRFSRRFPHRLPKVPQKFEKTSPKKANYGNDVSARRGLFVL